MFDSLPEAAKQAIALRETQVNKGLAKLQEYKGLDRFSEMAKRAGTMLTDAVRAYHNAEGALRKDFGSGQSRLCNLFRWIGQLQTLTAWLGPRHHPREFSVELIGRGRPLPFGSPFSVSYPQPASVDLPYPWGAAFCTLCRLEVLGLRTALPSEATPTTPG